jgi:hypothetical protein
VNIDKPGRIDKQRRQGDQRRDHSSRERDP